MDHRMVTIEEIKAFEQAFLKAKAEVEATPREDCPFCGSKNSAVATKTATFNSDHVCGYCVVCMDCGAVGGYVKTEINWDRDIEGLEDMKKAVEVWNRRKERS